VLARVGQALLDDAVRGASQGGGQRLSGRLDLRAHAHARRARLLDEAGDLVESGLRRLGRAVLGAVAQHPDHAAQVLERGVRRGTDHPGGLGDLLGRRVGPELQRARVQAEQ